MADPVVGYLDMQPMFQPYADHTFRRLGVPKHIHQGFLHDAKRRYLCSRSQGRQMLGCIDRDMKFPFVHCAVQARGALTDRGDQSKFIQDRRTQLIRYATAIADAADVDVHT